MEAPSGGSRQPVPLGPDSLIRLATKDGSYYFPPAPSSMLLTLTLHTQTGKNRCARVIVCHLRACLEQDLTYGEVLFIPSPSLHPLPPSLFRRAERDISEKIYNYNYLRGYFGTIIAFSFKDTIWSAERY
jgi:hypothetical protein